jgi:hypothetical protein
MFMTNSIKLLLASVASCAFLAACGGGGSSSTSVDNSNSNIVNPPVSTGQTDAKPRVRVEKIRQVQRYLKNSGSDLGQMKPISGMMKFRILIQIPLRTASTILTLLEQTEEQPPAP